MSKKNMAKWYQKASVQTAMASGPRSSDMIQAQMI
jgi:hypothetical protein